MIGANQLSITIRQIHQNVPPSNFYTIGYAVEHLACLKTQEYKIYITTHREDLWNSNNIKYIIKGPEFSRHFSLDHTNVFHIQASAQHVSKHHVMQQ